MIVASKFLSIFVIVISVAAGIASFYLLDAASKEQKKKRIETIISQLVNFVLFLWLAKILLNLSLFIQDPLAVLAYPADSSAFYLAVLFSFGLIFYQSRKGTIQAFLFVQSIIYVLVTAAFVYEFIQLIWFDNSLSVGNLVLMALLLLLFFFFKERISPSSLFIVVLAAFGIGMGALHLLQPYMAIFGFLMAPWFIGVFVLTGFVLIGFSRRKGQSEEDRMGGIQQ
ncbi:hypothetical protein [Planococcus salinus]|uniref:hypothetical protein n=1 Tax=Planococcus salinus TaxID=1848460 RepID=UPI0018649139|nr:hypothetical protein [Planococcus salinus]